MIRSNLARGIAILAVLASVGCRGPRLNGSAERYMEKIQKADEALRKADIERFGDDYADLLEEAEDYFRPGMFSDPPKPGACMAQRKLERQFPGSHAHRMAVCTDALLSCYGGDVAGAMRLWERRSGDPQWRHQASAYGFEAFPTVLAYAIAAGIRSGDRELEEKLLTVLRREYRDAWLFPPRESRRAPVSVRDFVDRPNAYRSSFVPVATGRRGGGR